MTRFTGEKFMERANAEVNEGFGAVIDCIMAVAEDYPEKGRKRNKAVGPYGDIQDRKCQKRRGEIAEAMFLAKAATIGFGIATPWGDSLKYDAVVDTGQRLFRVQVKSAHRVSASKGGGYHVRACSHRRRAYRASEIDMLVAYVVPLDAWYIFPPPAFVRMKSVRLFPVPGKKKSKFEEYREAWGWF
jgi:hypothetical protein